MPAVNVADASWLRAPAPAVAALIAQPEQWPRWWPGLRAELTEDRGAEGLRWQVAPSGGLTGSMEVWIEPVLDGVVAHYFLRLDPVAGHRVGPRRAAKVAHRYRVRAKALFWALGDRLDPDRWGRPGTPPAAAAAAAGTRPPAPGSR